MDKQLRIAPDDYVPLPHEGILHEMNKTGGTSAIWYNWNQQITVTNTASTCYTNTCSNQIWSNWNSNITTVNVQLTTSNQVWQTWIALPASAQIYAQPQVNQRTPEQRRAEEARYVAQQAEYAARTKAEAEVKVAAKKRAKKLLMDLLSEAQRSEYETSGSFAMEVGGKLYKFKQGRAGNVFEIDKATKREVRRYCIHHSTYETPDEDNLLAQKLLLEANEAEFRRIANVTQLS